MNAVDAVHFALPRLQFTKGRTTNSGTDAYKGLNLYGPFDNSEVALAEKSVLFVFPKQLQHLAHNLAKGLISGHKGFRGFEQMFRVPFTGKMLDNLSFDVDLSSLSSAAASYSYNEAITKWNENGDVANPQIAVVLVPRSDRWDTERPYYAAKAAFSRLGIPTQMVTSELLEDEGQLVWSIANIALALFAKLGGVPWVVEAPEGDNDLVIGIGRRDIRRPNGADRVFGYALSFSSNGLYRQTWAFKPAADENEYEKLLEEAVFSSLEASKAQLDLPPSRLVLHLGKKTGWKEIQAFERATDKAGVSTPTAFIRLDETMSYDIADGTNDTLAPLKGLAVRLGPRRVLLQTGASGLLRPPDGPLLLELDKRSSVGSEVLDEISAQAFRLSHANWRSFNAQSRPVTLVYGELLAQMVGYLEEVDTWKADLLSKELRNRPWFL